MADVQILGGFFIGLIAVGLWAAVSGPKPAPMKVTQEATPGSNAEDSAYLNAIEAEYESMVHQAWLTERM